MIYLWTNGSGWQAFGLSDTAELEKRKIRIGNRACIGDEARIGDGASIGNGACIGNGASIGDGARPVVIYIIGSRFPLSYWGEDRIDIGCTSRSIHEWLNDSEEIARKNNFNQEQTAEYRSYVELIAGLHAKENQV